MLNDPMYYLFVSKLSFCFKGLLAPLFLLNRSISFIYNIRSSCCSHILDFSQFSVKRFNIGQFNKTGTFVFTRIMPFCFLNNFELV